MVLARGADRREFSSGFQYAHRAKIHHIVLVLRRKPVLVIAIALEKNIAIAEPIFDRDRRGVYRPLMEYFGFFFDTAVACEEAVADNSGDVEYEYREAEDEDESYEIPEQGRRRSGALRGQAPMVYKKP